MSLGSWRSEKRGYYGDGVRWFSGNELSLTIATPVASFRDLLAFRRCFHVQGKKGQAWACKHAILGFFLIHLCLPFSPLPPLLVSHRTEKYLFSQSIPPSYTHFVLGIPSEMGTGAWISLTGRVALREVPSCLATPLWTD